MCTRKQGYFNLMKNYVSNAFKCGGAQEFMQDTPHGVSTNSKKRICGGARMGMGV